MNGLYVLAAMYRTDIKNKDKMANLIAAFRGIICLPAIIAFNFGRIGIEKINPKIRIIINSGVTSSER